MECNPKQSLQYQLSQRRKSTAEMFELFLLVAAWFSHSLEYSNQIIYENICTVFLVRISACQPKMNWHHNAVLWMVIWEHGLSVAAARAPGCRKTAAAIWQPNINTFKILIVRHNFNWLLLATTNCHFMRASCFLSVNYHYFRRHWHLSKDYRFS